MQNIVQGALQQACPAPTSPSVLHLSEQSLALAPTQVDSTVPAEGLGRFGPSAEESWPALQSGGSSRRQRAEPYAAGRPGGSHVQPTTPEDVGMRDAWENAGS